MSAQRIAPIALSLLFALGPGCHRQKDMQRGQPQYDVVEEGQTTGASSTINAPGEMPPPSTTTVDTTTNFTLPTGQTAAPTTTSQMTPPQGRGTAVPQQQPYVTPSEGIRWSQPHPTTVPARTATRPPESDGEHTSTEPPPADSSSTPREKTTSAPPAQTDTQAPPPTTTDTKGN